LKIVKKSIRRVIEVIASVVLSRSGGSGCVFSVNLCETKKLHCLSRFFGRVTQGYTEASRKGIEKTPKANIFQKIGYYTPCTGKIIG